MVPHGRQRPRDSQFQFQSLLDIANANGGIDSRTLAYFESLVWRRLGEVYEEAEGGMAIFKKSVEPSDVR